MQPSPIDALNQFNGLGRWIWLKDAAKLSGCKPVSLRLRLLRLNRLAGGGIIVKANGAKQGQYRLDLEALAAYHRSAAHLATHEIDELREMVLTTEVKMDALRRAQIDLRAALSTH